MTGPLHEVHLRQLPVRVWAQAQEQTDALRREFALITAGGHVPDHEVPHRLLDVVADLDARYSGVGSAQEDELYDAVAAGRMVIEDLVYTVPAEVAEVSQPLIALLEEADAYCAEGSHLLTLAAPEQVVRFRRWFLSQFADQVAGKPAVSWPDWP
jgi:hypothetical protein